MLLNEPQLPRILQLAQTVACRALPWKGVMGEIILKIGWSAL